MENIPGKILVDKYGNKISLCLKCNVPIFQVGAVITCMNGCYIGELNIGKDPTDPKPSFENDFNPIVTKICDKCKLEGWVFFKEDDHWCAKICDLCNGAGTIKERKYNDDNSTQELQVKENGVAKCPRCNYSFKVTNPSFWMGNRHKRCGKKLKVPEEWASKVLSQS